MDVLDDERLIEAVDEVMSEDFEVKYWTKALGVDREKLQKAVDKVGNSAAAVRKELGLLGACH